MHQLQSRLRQLGADHAGHAAADTEHHEREHQIQGADVLVIGGEHPAIKKTLRLVIGMIGGVLGAGIKGSCGHVVLPRSNSGGRQRAATEAVRAAASASVFCAISQASNSALGTALTTIGMKPWSLPHNSAHRSEEHTSELQSLRRIPNPVFSWIKTRLHKT